MSILAIDLGNTRWKLAMVAEGLVGEVVSGGYDEISCLTDALRSRQSRVDRVLLASVAPSWRTEMVTAEVTADSGPPVTAVVADRPLAGVRPGYRKPEQLGVDRLLAMVAVRSITGAPFCVIDAGTAVTLDFVDSEGQHLGGFILPGQQMSRERLLRQTAIPRDSTVSSGDLLGRDTPTGVLLGSLYAVTSIAEMFLVGNRSLFADQHAEVYVGGGDADSIADSLSLPCTKLEHLVLRGLAVVALSGDV